MTQRRIDRLVLASRPGSELYLLAEIADSLLGVTHTMGTLRRLSEVIDLLPEEAKEKITKELGDSWRLCIEDLTEVVQSLETVSYVLEGVHRRSIKPSLDATTRKRLDRMVREANFIGASSQLPGDEYQQDKLDSAERFFNFHTFNDGGTGVGDSHIPDQYAPLRGEDGDELAKISPEHPGIVTDWSGAKPEAIRPNIPKNVRR